MFIFSLPIFVACIKDYDNPDVKSPIQVDGDSSNTTSGDSATDNTTGGSSSGGSSSGGTTSGGSSSGGSSSGGTTSGGSSSGGSSSGGSSSGGSSSGGTTSGGSSSGGSSSGGSSSGGTTSGGSSSGGTTSGGSSSGGSSSGGSSSGGTTSGGSSSGGDSLQCDEELAEYPNVSECHTDEIQDGDILELTLVGGTTHFNSTIYSTSGWYCEPMATDTYQGPERAFHFQHPGGSQNCIVTLESNCGDLSLGALVWDVNTQACPEEGSYTPACEWSNDVGSGNEELVLYEYNPTNYLIVVDAKLPVDANFTLSVSCSLF